MSGIFGHVDFITSWDILHSGNKLQNSMNFNFAWLNSG